MRATSIVTLGGSATDRGPVREVNEDRVLCEDRYGLYAVFDGVGGHNAGEVAAQLALETARRLHRPLGHRCRRRHLAARLGSALLGDVQPPAHGRRAREPARPPGRAVRSEPAGHGDDRRRRARVGQHRLVRARRRQPHLPARSRAVASAHRRRCGDRRPARCRWRAHRIAARADARARRRERGHAVDGRDAGAGARPPAALQRRPARRGRSRGNRSRRPTSARRTRSPSG